MPTKKCHPSPFLVATGLGALLMLTLLALKLLVSPIPYPLVRQLLQGLGLITLFYWLNQVFLGVTVTFYNKRLPLFSQLITLIPLWFYMLWANLPLLFELKPDQIFPAFVASLNAGFTEEYLIRGLILGYLMRFSQKKVSYLWLSLLLSSLIFGVLHAPNILSQPFDFTIYQIIASGLSGLFDGAIYLRTKSLIWVIFAHFLQDFAALSSQGLEEAVHQTVQWPVLGIMLLVYGSFTLILLRPKQLPSVFNHDWA